jgi:hypothetical protein
LHLVANFLQIPHLLAGATDSNGRLRSRVSVKSVSGARGLRVLLVYSSLLSLTLGLLAVAVVIAPPLRAGLAAELLVSAGAVLAARAFLQAWILERIRRFEGDEIVTAGFLAPARRSSLGHVEHHLEIRRWPGGLRLRRTEVAGLRRFEGSEERLTVRLPWPA